MKRHLNEEGDVGEQCSSEVGQENAQKRQKHGVVYAMKIPARIALVRDMTLFKSLQYIAYYR